LNYPFNSQRGFRDTGIQTFSALGQEVFPGFGTFDQRDGQFLVGFDTDVDIPTGRGACGYVVEQATLTVAVQRDLSFQFDPTFDDWTTYINGAADADGRPIEMYGAAFRDLNPQGQPWSELNYFEGTAVTPGPAFGPSINSDVRFTYPTDYVGGVFRDVSNNVRDGFNPKPFAIGTTTGVSVGQFVPVDSMFTFNLNVADPDVQSFLGRQLDLGRIRLMITSLQPASSTGGPGTGEFASFYSKEVVFADGFWSAFSITVRLIPDADADKNGVVNFSDVTTTLGNWGNTGAPGIPGDANCDGVVNFSDVIAILGNWGATAP